MKSILLRISDEDHAMWSDQARKIGVSLSAWIRLRCGGYIQREPEKDELDMLVRARENAKAIAVHQVKVERTVAQTSAIRTCPHGVEVSWRCTLCGGIVK